MIYAIGGSHCYDLSYIRLLLKEHTLNYEGIPDIRNVSCLRDFGVSGKQPRADPHGVRKASGAASRHQGRDVI